MRYQTTICVQYSYKILTIILINMVHLSQDSTQQHIKYWCMLPMLYLAREYRYCNTTMQDREEQSAGAHSQYTNIYEY